MYWFRKYVYLVLSKKLDETKNFNKTDSFKIKVDKNDKNVILNFIQLSIVLQSSVCRFAGDLLDFFSNLRYTTHYMTVS